MSTCRSCGAEVRWVVTERGRRMPLDPDPVEVGNVEVVAEQGNGWPVVRVLGKVEAAAVPLLEPQARYRSHFVTCPNADAHRRSR